MKNIFVFDLIEKRAFEILGHRTREPAPSSTFRNNFVNKYICFGEHFQMILFGNITGYEFNINKKKQINYISCPFFNE